MEGGEGTWHFFFCIPISSQNQSVNISQITITLHVPRAPKVFFLSLALKWHVSFKAIEGVEYHLIAVDMSAGRIQYHLCHVE